MRLEKYSQNHRPAFSAGHAIDSFRSLNFTPISSICEIIDNSLQANATEIKINFEWNAHPDGDQYAKKSIFIDNGDGMNDELIYDYLILGEGQRRALEHGIGKFGVGATLAGISASRHIDVYSKVRGGKWMYTYLDIDEIQAADEAGGIPKPIQKDPPSEYNKSLEHGTIVIWSNVDKLERALIDSNLWPPNPITNVNQLHNEDILSTELGRIYRKFLTEERLEKGKTVKNKNRVTILLENQEIEPYDPLYATYNPKKDDKEKPTLTHQSIPIRYGKSSAKMHLTTSYFPESWWADEYRAGNAKDNRERKIGSRNEGMSLVREGREIFFGNIPYFRINDPGPERHAHTYKEQDRWIGFEVEFDRDADDIFNIQANKSKLEMRKIMKEELSRKMSHTIVQGRTDFATKTGESKVKKKIGGGDSPGGSKKKIQDQIDPKYNTEQKKELQEIAKQYVKDKNDKDAIDDAYNDLVHGYLPIADYDGDSTDQMVKFSFHLNSIVVKYNMHHPFLKKFVEALTDIGVKLGKNSTETLTVPENQTLRTLLDILFVTYGLARVSFDDLSKSREIQSTLNDLHKKWGDRAEEFSKKDLESADK